MPGGTRIVEVGDTPVRLSSAEADDQRGQSITAIPVDGSVTYGYNDEIVFGEGPRMGTDADLDQMRGFDKFLEFDEVLWAVADSGLTVNVAVDEQGI